MELTRDEVEGLPWRDIPSSSNIERVAFGDEPDKEPDVATLYVQYTGGRSYAYRDVPYEINVGIRKAVENGDSVGSFIHHNVRDAFEASAITVSDEDD